MVKYFYVITSKYRKTLCLGPFQNRQEVVDWQDTTPIEVLCSHAVEDHEKETVLYNLYTLIDKGINAWIQELKYIPRLINSALAFLVIYFFFSLVVRDPIPMVDEFILAGAGAVGVYIWTASLNRKSDLAMKKRLELKNLADKAIFNQNEALTVYEELLKKYDETPYITLADQILGDEGGLEDISESFAAQQIRDYLQLQLNTHDKTQQILKLLNRADTEKEKALLSANMLRLSSSKKIDLPLIALCISCFPNYLVHE